VYQLKPEVVPLTPEVYKGNLVCRARGSSQCVSYAQLKAGLVKKHTVIKLTVPGWM
jgi:hypothetical protein